MTKWFDTNYHYIVPEFEPNQQFILNNDVIINAFTEAKGYGIVNPKPVIIGPMSFLKLGKPKGKHFETTSLIHNLLPVYIELIGKLSNAGAEYIQIDEPYLCTMLSEKEKRYYSYVLNELFKSFPEAHFIIATYFGSVIYNRSIIEQLPNSTLHIDLIRSPEQLDDLLVHINENINLSLGIVDGRNIWKNDYTKSLKTIDKAQQALCSERLMIAPSCSLLHVPCDLDLENNERSLPPDIKAWMAFAYQKLTEINTLSKLADGNNKYTAEKNMSILKKIRMIFFRGINPNLFLTYQFRGGFLKYAKKTLIGKLHILFDIRNKKKNSGCPFADHYNWFFSSNKRNSRLAIKV